MPDREVLTIEKIPLHLSLYHLSSSTCLAYSGRHYFSALGRHALRHPLMHQIDHNPDCRALAICADDQPVALCFFHYRVNTPEKKAVILHNFMVAPFMRSRGLGSLLAVYFLDGLIDGQTRQIDVELEFPRPAEGSHFASPIMQELTAAKNYSVGGEDMGMLSARLKQEEKSLSRAILKSLVTHPEFKERMQREQCFIGAVSCSNEFFEQISGLNLPGHAAVQSIHTGFHKDIESKLAPFDLLIVEDTVLEEQPALLDNIARTAPGLQVVVAGEGPMLDHPTVILAAPMKELAQALLPHVDYYDPRNATLDGRAITKNLLHLPERGVLAYFKNRHVEERVFIVASGPSLSDVDPELLRNETTITINDALLMFPGTQYAAVMDSRKLHELHEPLLNVEALFTLAGNSYGVEIELLGTEGFNLELEKGIYSGYTTAYFCLQLALFMGFREICYLGLDLGNTSEKSHFFGSRPLQDRDRPDVYAKMRKSFERVTDTVRQMGARVYNCSPVSELKCFSYKTIEEIQVEPPRPRSIRRLGSYR